MHLCLASMSHNHVTHRRCAPIYHNDVSHTCLFASMFHIGVPRIRTYASHKCITSMYHSYATQLFSTSMYRIYVSPRHITSVQSLCNTSMHSIYVSHLCIAHVYQMDIYISMLGCVAGGSLFVFAPTLPNCIRPCEVATAHMRTAPSHDRHKLKSFCYVSRPSPLCLRPCANWADPMRTASTHGRLTLKKHTPILSRPCRRHRVESDNKKEGCLVESSPAIYV